MAIVRQITQYEAKDGSLFLTEAECNQHEFLLDNKAEIDAAGEAFVNTIGACGRSRNGKLNTVSEFLSFYIPWVEAGKPVVERTVMEPEVVEAPVAEGVAEVAADAVDGAEAEPAF